MKRAVEFIHNQKPFHLFAFAIVLAGIAGTLALIQNQQDVRSNAMTLGVTTPGVYFVDSTQNTISETNSSQVNVLLNSPWSSVPNAAYNGFELVQKAYAQASAPVSVTYRVSGSANDAIQDGSTLDTTAKTTWLGNGQGTSHLGLRFQNITIPKNSTVQTANLQVYSTQGQWITISMNIGAHATGNSSAFSTSSLPSQRGLTTARVTHSSNTRWNSNTWYSVQNVGPVVQEIVNRSDWQSGNSMSLILRGTANQYGRKYFRSADATGSLAPRLVVTYISGQSTPPTPTVSIPTVTPGPTNTPIPTATPTSIPTNTPIPTATPLPVATQVILAEDALFTQNVVVVPFSGDSNVASYTFASAAPGLKTIYAKFISSLGEERVFSSSITLVLPTPTNGTGITPVPTDHTSSGTNSMAMGRWNPNTNYDTCTNPADTARIKEIHDSYKVKGPDGKWYPTWHPPVDPATGCKFGHEHGRDPKGSDLFAFAQDTYGFDENNNAVLDPSERGVSGIPMGYVNGKLDEYNTSQGISSSHGMRHEDHVGHKFEWENNVERDWSTNIGGGSGGQRTPSGITCDLMMKIHQGTHSKDAFTNNLHELFQFAECSDGLRMANAIMVAFAKPGEFNAGRVNGTNVTIVVGTATPPNSPTGKGSRAIPDMTSVVEHILKPQGQWSLFSNGIYEDWISGNYLRTPNGAQIAYFDPHFAVFTPSRFYWPGDDPNTYGITRTAQDKADNVGRSIDSCYMSEKNGTEIARGGECTWMGNLQPRIAYDDPRSVFNGIKREMYFNNFSVEYSVGSSRVWYADPFGNKATTTPFTGSTKHYLKPKTSTQAYPYPFESDALGGNRYYGGNGVHAPN